MLTLLRLANSKQSFTRNDIEGLQGRISQRLSAAILMIAVIIGISGMLLQLGWSEEAGSGHYFPGATASFIDMLPDRNAFSLVYANAFTYYDGSAAGNLELGGLLTADATATVYADSSLFLFQTPWRLLGGQYGGSIIVPYYWMQVNASILLNIKPGIRNISIRAEDTANGFGDVQLLPLMFGWKFNDLKLQSQFSVYAPTGSFNKDDLANIGRNYWTFEPAIAASYLSSKIGLELTGFAAIDFNTENNTTDYQTGDQCHLDVTVAQHLPLFGGFGGIGANGFYYQQVTGDSGSGARLGSFEGMTTGIGPVGSYAYSFGRLDLASEVKWLPELSTDHRLNGNIIWFKIGISFAPSPTVPLSGM